MSNPVGFKQDILPLFTQTDIAHMSGMGVLLNNYQYMSNPAGGTLGSSPNYADHANARGVYSYLTGETSPQMPLGAAPWTAQQLSAYQQWMNDGFAP
jgi:hypothetical protein